MRIGPVAVAHPLTLAALEEHSNYPFRLLMKDFGASLVLRKRVDASAVARRGAPRLAAALYRGGRTARAGQLSGRDADALAAAAAVVEELGFDLVDLNFECPVRRLLDHGEGGALLAEPATIGRLVAAIVAVSIPVTLKVRSGPDADHPTAVEVAQQPAGPHRRGPSDWLENAGLTSGRGAGVFVTGDLCPSHLPLDRAFLQSLEQKGAAPPIALSISGLWLERHAEDFAWLRREKAEGRLKSPSSIIPTTIPTGPASPTPRTSCSRPASTGRRRSSTSKGCSSPTARRHRCFSAFPA